MSAVISCENETLPAKSIDKEAAFSDLIHLIKARRNDFQKLSHVPRDVVNAMKRAGIFRASTPKRFGGDALPATDFLKMVERIAEADGSAGWVAAFGSANTYLAALPLETQAMIYADGPDQVYGGGLYPLQPAQRVHGGWKVSGRWRFASGCKCADWLSVGIGAAGPNGMAGKPLAAVLPASRVEIIDNWDVVGMQGTGSHDLQLHNEFVADEWTFVRGGAVTVDEPIFRYPAVALQAQVHAAVNLGLAKAALEILIEMGGVGNATQGTSKLADRSYYRMALGRAQAHYLSARAFYYEATESAWDVLARGDELTLQQTNRVRLAATNAAHTCADVINSAYKLAGMSAIFNSNRLQWLVRDAMVVTQHATLSEATYDSAGAIFAGVSPSVPYP
ncbi:acyl-CoA dehydrogenase family protein [Azohydromonas lata]|uniref:Acyl-CoA dehydrogenase family protein n=1 Tax=Azohydromonas lata TaxID=45677 RepID=A0ABU5IC93_9BURK|nr:acyl-CoA dehydrogenase family protein [Azohydromonas lata]MDZ5456300.1 acyl-CoA dehydrogenase family protein [Azohydromonas lata]